MDVTLKNMYEFFLETETNLIFVNLDSKKKSLENTFLVPTKMESKICKRYTFTYTIAYFECNP